MTMYYGVDMAATGAHIRQLRQEHGLSVRNIQEVMGFDSPSAVYKWERGRSLPSIEHLMVLGKLFDMQMEDIIIWSRPPPGTRAEREHRGVRDQTTTNRTQLAVRSMGRITLKRSGV